MWWSVHELLMVTEWRHRGDVVECTWAVNDN